MSDDQAAAASRERDREMHRAYHEGEEVTIRTMIVEVTPSAAEALARGEVPPAVQAQIDRQSAEDEVVKGMEHTW